MSVAAYDQHMERIEWYLICLVGLQVVWIVVLVVGMMNVRKMVLQLLMEASTTINSLHERLVEIKSVMETVQTIWQATSGGAVSLLSSAASAASSLRTRFTKHASSS